jgi:hypothetical protein
MKFAIVCEAPADRRIAQDLVDRVIVTSVDWADEILDSLRTWCNTVVFNDQYWQLEWTAIKGLAKAMNLRIHGHFDGEPGAPDAATARRALIVLQRLLEPNAIFLVRDMDNHTDRFLGLEQARNHFSSQEVKIVIGLAIPEREAWVLAGFVPKDETEQELLLAERQNLGFDPCERSVELTAGRDDTAKRSPKRVLKVLTCDSTDREVDCWTATPLETLKTRGAENGLTSFLYEIESFVVPLIDGRRRVDQ